MLETVNVKIDTDVKELATHLFARMGIDQTTAIDMFYRQVIVERRLPFQPIAAPTLDKQILAAMKTKNIPEVTLDCDERGNLIVDKEKHPEIYDWLLI